MSYLKNRFPERKSLRINDFKDITSGWETQIFSFDLEWNSEQSQMQDGLIIRVYAPGISEKAERESGVMNQLQEIGYPVPQVHLIETDESKLGNPFMIMDRINGGTLEDRLNMPNVDHPKWLKLFSKLFVDLHKLDWTYFVSKVEAKQFDDPFFIIKNTLTKYREYLARFKKTELTPILEWLKHRIESVPCKMPSMIHGDFHPMNIMFDEQENPFVIDWGASHVSDYRFDLAWTLVLNRAYSSKENRDWVLGGYQTAIGHEVEEIEYFEVLGILRRLLDVLVSMDDGAISWGLREGAVELMKEQMGHIRVVYEMLGELTEIKIPEVETWIESVS
ncbi:MAG: phosphotransferase family protein [Candidatus Thorarchaeota archaeon]